MIAAVLALVAAATAAPVPQADGPVRGLLDAFFGKEASQHFAIGPQLPPSACDPKAHGCFEYESHEAANGTTVVTLRGTSGVELASAVHHYAKNYLNASFSWKAAGGVQNLRCVGIKNVPQVPSKIHVDRVQKYHYHANVCTFSYSYAWYSWEDWQYEIYWMALHGVNLPLAYTGQEKVYQKVYNQMGVNDSDLSAFFPGPAFLAWGRGQNLMGWGGPLPQDFIDSQWALQKQILQLMRSFGMKPVLPAFQGNVPLPFLKLYPSANISRVGNCALNVEKEYGCAAWLDVLDPLFNKTADLFLKTLIEDFGTDHFYAADGTFSTAQAPWTAVASKDPTPDAEAQAHSAAAYASIARTDPEAIWLYQTWSWQYGAKDSYIKGWVSGPPHGRLLLLDLMAEEAPLWQRTGNFYGTPFIWCMLHNFGGNNGMWGDLPSLNRGPVEALADAGELMQGTGMTMEGTNTNPVVYDFISEMVYNKASVPDIDKWALKYADRRYGIQRDCLRKAWSILRQTAYNASGYGMLWSKDSLTAVPYGTPWDQVNGSHWYNETLFREAWDQLLQLPEGDRTMLASHNFSTYVHDLVDVTAQALSKLSTIFVKNLIAAVGARNASAAALHGRALVELINDVDEVLSGSKDFLFGHFLEQVAAAARTDDEKRLYTWNFKTQVTFWSFSYPATEGGPPVNTPYLMDYAARHWAGLMRTYYAPRWQLYTTEAVHGIQEGTPITATAWHTSLISWYQGWMTENHNFSSIPTTDAYNVSASLFQKYAAHFVGL